ncbi:MULTISPECIES: hypothetical protein [unclassified Streptomyces]|uniref:hypothetical protein n=1 Tax=unclassified Streptomyces TaxID=2593676 RepID=UPI0003776CC0|nr:MULTISPECIES: hypothetical protein [unclassified Streptomyces]
MHDLEVRKAKQPWLDGAHYQMAEVALQIIDHVAIAMDYDTGANHEEVLLRAQEFVGWQAPGRPVEEHSRVAGWVLDSLINVRDTERGFRRNYGEVDSTGAYALRQWDFKLIEERTDSNGDLYLRASNEALNVLVGALDTDVESAQIAAEVRLRNLIDRGRLADAKAVAEQARIRTIQYAEIIRAHLDATSRNVTTVDWRDEVPDLLNEALDHVDHRLQEEGAIARSVTVDRDQAQDPARKRQAAELVDIVEDCIRRHTRLQTRLRGARTLFLDEQDRQQFSGTVRRAPVDVYGDLLQPVLGLTLGDAADPVRSFYKHSSGPTLDDQFCLATFVPTLLAPPVDRARLTGEEEEPELLPVVEVRGFSDDQQTMAETLLDLPDEARPLSELLAEAAVIDPQLPELVTLLALRAFSPQLGSALREGADRVLLAVSAGVPLDSESFEGDDLLLTSAAFDRVALDADGPARGGGR